VALRESQERLKAVVAELQHRTRNLIGIVGTIAKRTLKTSKTFDDFEASFQDRLEVLGRTQGLLFRAEAGGQVETAGESGKPRLHLDWKESGVEMPALGGQPAGHRARKRVDRTGVALSI
jgi:hypothetical protein